MKVQTFRDLWTERFLKTYIFTKLYKLFIVEIAQGNFY